MVIINLKLQVIATFYIPTGDSVKFPSVLFM